MDVCKRVRYSGRVQGVGFRYTTERLAQGFRVGGYVRNLPGGEVELVVEGAEDEVRRFLAQVAGRMQENIDAVTESPETPSGFRDFRVRF